MSKEEQSALDDSIGEDSELEVSCMLQDLKEKVDVFKDGMEARATEDDIVDEVIVSITCKRFQCNIIHEFE